MSDHPTFSRLDYLKALAVVVIWGVNFVAMKVALPGLGPMLLGALRYAAASLPFILFVRCPRVPWRFVVLYGLLQGVGQFGLLFTGLALLASSHGSLPGQMTLIGFFLTLGAGLMWAASNLVVRFMGRQSSSYDPFAFIIWTSLMPIIPFLCAAMALNGVQPTLQALVHITLEQCLAVAFLALLATLLAYSLWTGLLRRFAAGRVAPFSLLVPLVGLLCAYVAFGEQLNLVQVLGTAGVLLGLLVNQLGGRLRAQKPAPVPA